MYTVNTLGPEKAELREIILKQNMNRRFDLINQIISATH